MAIELQHTDAVFFDLDDTLADTLGTLVGPALRQAAADMVAAGLDTDETAAAAFMRQLAAHGRGADYFTAAVQRFGPTSNEAPAIAEIGRRTYFTTDVAAIRLLPGARRLLEALAPDHALFLVTAGDPDTQQRKVERLAIGRFFRAVRTVSSVIGEHKRDAFKELVADHALAPQHCVCVGDRLVGEIRDCNELGMTTVWMRRGEFRHLGPQTDNDQPSHTIVSLDELAALLGVGQKTAGERDARASQ
ncbi:MAG TPA: HAD hydrolase-like protein [Acidobacteriota bacterium]|nr:HAD hydrolase-like protein [Acidobacteriota bacterium]